ncbi:hypothetical protein B566_EDAN016194 [Ephemera danica]|nr:hypothetical protein B566_EDAN016194 [Ephemera danica]
MAAEKVKRAPKSVNISAEDIFQGFQNLRNEQRKLANKISELEMDLNEHKIVVDALEKVDGDRKCFRLINGILVQRTVKDIKPVLITNRGHLEETIKTMNELLTKKGEELNNYKERYNIRIRGAAEMEGMEESAPNPGPAPANTGVLVDKA